MSRYLFQGAFSEELITITKTIFVGTVDLCIGVLVSKFIDGLFNPVEAENVNKKTGDNKGEFSIKNTIKTYVDDKSMDWRKGFWGYFWKAITQLSATLIAGLALRRITYPSTLQDPTGGILFVLSLFRQKNFWDNVDNAYNYLVWYVGSIYLLNSNW